MKQKENPKSLNIWKVLAIVFITLFVATLVFGLFKLHRFKQTLADPTDAQVESAKAIAMQDLESRGVNTSAYTIKVAPKVRGMREAGADRNIIQVFAEADASRHNYMIDTDAGMILLHSQTEVYGWMADMDKRMMMPGGPEGRPSGCMGGPNDSENDGKPCERQTPGQVTGFPMYPMHRRE